MTEIIASPLLDGGGDDTGRFTGAKNGRLKITPGAPSTDTYTFAQLADTQLGMMPAMRRLQWLRKLRCIIKAATCGTNDGKKLLPVPLYNEPTGASTDDAVYELEMDLARMAVDVINEMTPMPAFAVVCGDLVHAFPDKDPKTHRKQVADFKAIFQNVRPEIPLVCLCGNHDVGERPTAATLSNFRANFGDDYFTFWVGRDKYIVINSQLYKDGSAALEARSRQDAWLDEALTEGAEQARHTVVFSHIPPFIEDPNEASGYFPLERTTRLDLLTRMATNGVSHWFCGHYHRNAGGFFKLPANAPGDAEKLLEVVTTAAVGGNLETDAGGDAIGLSGMRSVSLSEDLSGMRVVCVDCEGISHRFGTLREMKVQQRNRL